MYQKPDQALINYQEYRWGGLDQLYRGPRPDLARPYIACLGDGHTFGRYVEQPFPARLARALGFPVANFGTATAGSGFFLRDPTVLQAASDAKICILQVMSARSLSNRLFQVKLTRNAQVGAVSKALEALFPHVDFETFSYAHNMLNQIAADDPESFLTVAAEMKTAWVARTRSLLQSIRTKRVLFWLSERAPEETGGDEHTAWLKYPQFVDREMIDAIAPLVDRVVICACAEGLPQSLLRDGEAVLQTPFGMPISENRYYPSPEMHEAAARALAGPVGELLASDEPGVFAQPNSVLI